LVADLQTRFRRHTTQEWLERLRGKVPCAPVNSLAEALQDEQVLAREMLTIVEHPTFGPLRQVRTAIQPSAAGEPDRPGPALGADTDAILRRLLNYSDETIAGLRRKGAI
jgi:crotonobetainyl-CoA:carnitine CoA-transferase CaiB-like acyl-CoA transferase